MKPQHKQTLFQFRLLCTTCSSFTCLYSIYISTYLSIYLSIYLSVVRLPVRLASQPDSYHRQIGDRYSYWHEYCRHNYPLSQWYCRHNQPSVCQAINSITSMARTRMACLPWMIRTLFFQSIQNSSNSSRKQIFRDFFLILSWNCMLCVLIRIEAILMSSFNIQSLCRKSKRFP